MKDHSLSLSLGKKASGNDNNLPTIPDTPQGSNMPPTSPEGTAIMGALEIAKEVTRCYTDYVKCREHEITERKRIMATLKAMKYCVDAQKEIFLKQLELEYEERNRMYDSIEMAQKVALETNDRELLRESMYWMLQVFQGKSKTDIKCFIEGSSLITRNF